MPGFDSEGEESDDDDDGTKTPFEKLAAKMTTNITEDGEVKKRMLQQGVEGNLKEGNVVKSKFENLRNVGRL